jgi:hypothetical protein
MRVHPVAGVVAIIFIIGGIVIAWRGERLAQQLEHARSTRLEALPDNARQIRAQLSAPSLDAEERKRLQRELDDCEKGITGIPGHFAANERNMGYGCGVGLAVLGLACLLYKPKSQQHVSDGAIR